MSRFLNSYEGGSTSGRVKAKVLKMLGKESESLGAEAETRYNQPCQVRRL